jgi:hypothetical protein
VDAEHRREAQPSAQALFEHRASRSPVHAVDDPGLRADAQSQERELPELVGLRQAGLKSRSGPHTETAARRFVVVDHRRYFSLPSTTVVKEVSMGFWEDASPAVKGAIIVGGIAILYFVVARFAGLPPYGGGEEEVQQVRGVQSQ